MSRRLAAVTVAAFVMSGAAVTGGAVAADTPRSTAGVAVRALVAAYDRGDAGRICRAKGQDPDRSGRCALENR